MMRALCPASGRRVRLRFERPPVPRPSFMFQTGGLLKQPVCALYRSARFTHERPRRLQPLDGSSIAAGANTNDGICRAAGYILEGGHLRIGQVLDCLKMGG